MLLDKICFRVFKSIQKDLRAFQRLPEAPRGSQRIFFVSNAMSDNLLSIEYLNKKCLSLASRFNVTS